MSEPKPERPARTGARRKQPEVSRGLPPIVCSRCNGPIVPGQQVAPLFSTKPVRWSEHPVLSKPPMIRGIIPTDGSPGRVDMSVGDQLRQRAAMGGERERASSRRSRRCSRSASRTRLSRNCGGKRTRTEWTY